MVKNEEGEVKCLRPNGMVIYLAEHIVLDSMLLKSMDLVIAPEPFKMNVKIDEQLEVVENEVAQADSAKKKRKYTKKNNNMFEPKKSTRVFRI